MRIHANPDVFRRAVKMALLAQDRERALNRDGDPLPDHFMDAAVAWIDVTMKTMGQLVMAVHGVKGELDRPIALEVDGRLIVVTRDSHHSEVDPLVFIVEPADFVRLTIDRRTKE